MIYVVNLYFFLKLAGNILGAAYNQVQFIVMNLRYSSFQRRLVTQQNVFDREMKSIHHFREDWLLRERFQSGN